MLTSSIRIGRIAGIEVGINWTWFLVFALIAFTLAQVVFPETTPDLATGAYWAMGAIAAFLFFGSILLHELGHAIQARRDDVEIEGITLWLFGGVAKFKDLYASPGSEFRIALAGPLVTVAIAAVLFGVIAAISLPAAVDGVVTWLALINLIVLAFNLLPALPLDGGRLLHAGLWQARGDLRWATRVGAGIGVGFGYFLAGAGIALFIFTTAIGGLWMALIGWFLATAARAEATQLEAREALEGLSVADLMAHDPVAITPDLTLSRFVDDVARRTRFTTYPVIEDGGRPVGLLTFRQVSGAPRADWDGDRVADHMIPRDEVPVVAPDDAAEDAFRRIVGDDLRRALVVDRGRLVGMLSVTDFMRAIELPGLGRAASSSRAVGPAGHRSR
jgi:Zn-dependent protease/CBS domain-containing protein